MSERPAIAGYERGVAIRTGCRARDPEPPILARGIPRCRARASYGRKRGGTTSTAPSAQGEARALRRERAVNTELVAIYLQDARISFTPLCLHPAKTICLPGRTRSRRSKQFETAHGPSRLPYVIPNVIGQCFVTCLGACDLSLYPVTYLSCAADPGQSGYEIGQH